MPVQLPAARGPARVWVIAHTLEVNNPRAEQLTTSSMTESLGLRTTAAGSNVTQQSRSPLVTQVLRTRVTEAPRPMSRSESQPPSTDVAAIAQNGREPNTAMLCIESPRSLTK